MDVRSPTRGNAVYHPEVACSRRRQRRMRAAIKAALVLATLAVIVLVAVALIALFTGGFR
ncbi:hypothetical protein [Rhizobium sp. Leaf383]|uniref:hypothetical protein n=1 Tax=Rhizobium sp. Leaf383 TaxID=1736357 RepID=UPI000715F3AD|nr:hypothetical protein [Rhizobium sp. Leaf383]KQS86960.1 hypothetical protein ASG58_01570 [Rhizobium sp. Leaf383]